jgi:hypothetical protein
MQRAKDLAHKQYEAICYLLDIKVGEVSFLKQGYWWNKTANGFRLERDGRELFIAVYAEDYQHMSSNDDRAEIQFIIRPFGEAIYLRDIASAARYLAGK